MKKEEKSATKLAYRYLTAWQTIRFGRKPNFDMRYNVSKLAVKIINSKKDSINTQEITAKRKERAANRYVFSNVLSNPLVKDFIANKSGVRFISDERISFYGDRNHWAKGETDTAILKILRRTFNQK